MQLLSIASLLPLLTFAVHPSEWKCDYPQLHVNYSLVHSQCLLLESLINDCCRQQQHCQVNKEMLCEDSVKKCIRKISNISSCGLHGKTTILVANSHKHAAPPKKKEQPPVKHRRNIFDGMRQNCPGSKARLDTCSLKYSQCINGTSVEKKQMATTPKTVDPPFSGKSCEEDVDDCLNNIKNEVEAAGATGSCMYEIGYARGLLKAYTLSWQQIIEINFLRPFFRFAVTGYTEVTSEYNRVTVYVIGSILIFLVTAMIIIVFCTCPSDSVKAITVDNGTTVEEGGLNKQSLHIPDNYISQVGNSKSYAPSNSKSSRRTSRSAKTPRNEPLQCTTVHCSDSSKSASSIDSRNRK